MLAPAGTFVLYALGLLALVYVFGPRRWRGYIIGLALGLTWLAAMPHGM